MDSEAEKTIDTQQLVLAAQEKASKEKAMDAHAMVKVEEFLLKHKDRVRQWVDSNPSQRPPVYYDERTDTVVWETRKQRRKALSPKKLARDSSRQLQTKAKLDLHQRMISNLTASNSKPEPSPKEVANDEGQNERQAPPEPQHGECAGGGHGG